MDCCCSSGLGWKKKKKKAPKSMFFWDKLVKVNVGYVDAQNKIEQLLRMFYHMTKCPC